MLKKVVLDTDMGVDCDDCAALAILLNKHKKKECELLCVTASSTREGATATIQAICDYYNTVVPIGAMALPQLPCDKMNNYAKSVKEKYNTKDTSVDAVKLLREKISNSKEKVTFIAIGPLVNVRRFLESQGDEISSKSGLEIAKEKIEALYIMGGSFIENYKLLGMKIEGHFPEWNILQDIESAQIVVDKFPNEMYFIPWEAGWEVFTDKGEDDNPVWYGMEEYARAEGFEVEGFKRHSWDPITCLCATEDCSNYFEFSPTGKVTVTEKGHTLHNVGEGKARIALLKKSFREIADVINEKVAPIGR